MEFDATGLDNFAVSRNPDDIVHGMFFDVVSGAADHRPRKHTLLVKPAEKVSIDVTADALGEWALHCHLMYHMHAGMFRVVSVREADHSMHHTEEQS